MATLPTQTFTQLVRGQVAAIQGAAAGLIDFTVGSILRAVVESNGQVTLWLQGLIIALLATTRFGTSTGTDADSFGADYDFPRLKAAPASTAETFGRFSATAQAVVQIGDTVELQDGSQQYAVVTDPTNPAYSAALGGYVLPIGTTSINVPIQAAVAGSGANCIAGAINTITSSIPGIDFCSNASAVENGEDQEGDAAYRVRFVAFINSLSRAIKAAVELAATSVQLNVSCAVIENQTYAGAAQPGFFCVIVDDGTGAPPGTLLNLAGQAVEAVRGLTIQYAIFPPVVLAATVSMSVQIATGYDVNATLLAVSTAVQTYMGGLTLNQGMPWTRLAQLAYDASPGVTDVSNIRLNGGEVDLPGSPKQVIHLVSLSVVQA